MINDLHGATCEGKKVQDLHESWHQVCHGASESPKSVAYSVLVEITVQNVKHQHNEVQQDHSNIHSLSPTSHTHRTGSSSKSGRCMRQEKAARQALDDEQRPT